MTADKKRILTINPGSTSTKIAVYEGEQAILQTTLRHPTEELQVFPSIVDQFSFRKELILDALKQSAIDIHSIDMVVGRGGLVHPIESGIYEVNDEMAEDLRKGVMGEHASNLGGLIARDIVKDLHNVKAYIADPVVVDELQDVARISGHPQFERVSIFHALNQKAIARCYAKESGKQYEDLNLIVAHLGGGISVGAHKKGRVVDVNNALNGDGPFSPERSGGLPVLQLAEFCLSGKADLKTVSRMITGNGGFVAYLGTNNAYDVEKAAENGDSKAALIQEAMFYQISKEIGAAAVVLEGKVDAILVTGGVAYNPHAVEYIKRHTEFIAPVHVYPGEDEMWALASNGLMVMNGEVEGKVYGRSEL
ncbi:MAG: butyrate kinase [Bacteroidales bacterium]|nr:butyrate kinase [Bacteroidales bacterium]